MTTITDAQAIAIGMTEAPLANGSYPRFALMLRCADEQIWLTKLDGDNNYMPVARQADYESAMATLEMFHVTVASYRHRAHDLGGSIQGVLTGRYARALETAKLANERGVQSVVAERLDILTELSDDISAYAAVLQQ